MEDAISKIIISTQDAYQVINVPDIIYCKSDHSHTTFFVKNKESIKVSISIKKVEEKLQAEKFIRPHLSYLVNPYHVQSISKNHDIGIHLVGGGTIPISKRLRKTFLEQFGKAVCIKM